MNKYPKVLILGQYFSDSSGSGITLSNLFKDWPREKLAIAMRDDIDKGKINFDLCNNIYFLGNKEIKVIFPFNFFYKLDKSKKVKSDKVFNSYLTSNTTNESNQLSTKKTYTKAVKKILKKTGLNSIKFQYRVSDDLLSWIKDYNPDIIYTALGDLDITFFTIELKKMTAIKTVIHIFDDWPNTLFQNYIFIGIWKRIFDKYFSEMIRLADLHLSISTFMSEEYKIKYNYNFIPFHNPIDSSKWISKNSWGGNNTHKKIYYFGKINRDTDDSLILLSNVVETLNINKIDVTFHIYTNKNDESIKIFKNFNFTIIEDYVDQKNLPNTIIQADILFLPLNFSKSSVKYTRLSIPTKLTEYMIAGVPSIVLAHPSLALSKFTKENDWAVLVDKFDSDMLQEKVIELLNNQSLQEHYGIKARNTAMSKFEGDNLREKFRVVLSG